MPGALVSQPATFHGKICRNPNANNTFDEQLHLVRQENDVRHRLHHCYLAVLLVVESSSLPLSFPISCRIVGKALQESRETAAMDKGRAFFFQTAVALPRRDDPDLALHPETCAVDAGSKR